MYSGTASKILFPALRIGYLVVPPDLVPRFAAVRDAMDIFPPALFQAALGDFIAAGHFARHLRRTRQLYRERRSVLAEALRKELGQGLVLGYGGSNASAIPAAVRRLRDVLEPRRES